MVIKYIVDEDKREKLATEISEWLEIPMEKNGEDYVIDIYTVTARGELVFYDRADSEEVEQLLEHLNDCGFEFEETDKRDILFEEAVAELRERMRDIAERIEALEMATTQDQSVNEKDVAFLRAKLETICERTETSLSGMQLLVDYYIKSLHWSEAQALQYAIDLFKDGTITRIKLIGKNGEEL